MMVAAWAQLVQESGSSLASCLALALNGACWILFDGYVVPG